MDLSKLRAEIDAIDNELVKLFCVRMEISARVADYKRTNGLPIFHPDREQEILQNISGKAGPELASYIRSLYCTLFELSRRYQHSRNNSEVDL